MDRRIGNGQLSLPWCSAARIAIWAGGRSARRPARTARPAGRSGLGSACASPPGTA